MRHIDFQEYIENQKPEHVLLIHHWDTDGLASMALFMDYLEEVGFEGETSVMCPTINNYFLTEDEFSDIEAMNPDGIMTMDINFPLDVIERLESIANPMFVFDHHSQTANIERPGVQDTNYPGNSMLVNDYLMKPLSLTAVLGMVGDQEDRLKERTDFYPQVEEMMKEHSLSFDEVLRVSKLMDTMYMVGDVEGFYYDIDMLRDDPTKALTDERLLKNEAHIQEEMERTLAQDMEEVFDGALFMPIQSDLSLISEATRAKAKAHPDKLIITHQIYNEDEASFYVRRRDVDIDLGIVVDMARAKGYNAGGKPEVAGVVLPGRDVEAFKQEVIALLQQHV